MSCVYVGIYALRIYIYIYIYIYVRLTIEKVLPVVLFVKFCSFLSHNNDDDDDDDV
jgi:hypothetical protein